MFCMSCGAQLPDDARFCFKCGRTTTQTEQPNASSQYAPSSSPTMDDIVSKLRRLFLSVADEFEKRGGDNPFKLMSDSTLEGIYDKVDLWKNLTAEQISALVMPDRFNQTDKQFMENKPMVFITYLDMLRHFAQGIESPSLLQGAFEIKSLLFYGNNW